MKTVYGIRPITDICKKWIEDNLCLESWQWLGDVACIEHRYIETILEGITEAGFGKEDFELV